MTDLGVVSLIAAVWWAGALLTLILSFAAALLFPWPRRRSPGSANPPPVTAIVPIKELDAFFETAQASLFAQDYPNLEIVIASAERRSPALTVARRVRESNPHVPSRISCAAIERAISPKLNNIWVPVSEACHNHILTKDSNVVLRAGDLDSFVRHLARDVGLVSAVPVVTEPQSFAAWAEASIINGYFARMLMFARAAGFGFGCGKIMLFRRADVERAGGFANIAWALGEDAALTAAIASLGLRTVLADRVTHQPLGHRHWRDVWNRQLRWRLIWRVQVPSIFFGALFGSAFLAALAGAMCAPLFGYPRETLGAATLVFWFTAETVLSLAKGWPVSLWSPVAFLGREVLEILVWLRALTTSEVTWAGNSCRAGKPRRETGVSAGLNPLFQRDAGAPHD